MITTRTSLQLISYSLGHQSSIQHQSTAASSIITCILFFALLNGLPGLMREGMSGIPLALFCLCTVRFTVTVSLYMYACRHTCPAGLMRYRNVLGYSSIAKHLKPSPVYPLSHPFKNHCTSSRSLSPRLHTNIAEIQNYICIHINL